MKIESGKAYKVMRYTITGNANYGSLPGEDVKRLLKGYDYDADLGMWFSRKGYIGYSVEEI